ncbi:hypothetical protein M0812_15156 [Anaeramoeba flamelloides]|uniref:Uncharacterized protein n=1 Tax=Anaeramoeba flamelloides TaxID=1746091 RepID=A0AAV7ZH70_9EUKA|nr:hypothetical protein M0812_15156 [Anaeramoeba flamelloides]
MSGGLSLQSENSQMNNFMQDLDELDGLLNEETQSTNNNNNNTRRSDKQAKTFFKDSRSKLIRSLKYKWQPFNVN